MLIIFGLALVIVLFAIMISLSNKREKDIILRIITITFLLYIIIRILSIWLLNLTIFQILMMSYI